MSITAMTMAIVDYGGRRLGIDRRQFLYTSYIPNRRMDEDRRSGNDRRTGLDRRSIIERRTDKVEFKTVQKPENDLGKGKDLRSGLERRIAFAAALAT